MVFIVAPCSRLGRAGSPSRAGGDRALQVLGGEAPTARPRARTQRRRARDRGHGERWAMAEGEEGQRGYREGIFAGRFPLSLPAPGRAFPGTPGVLGRAGPGRGKCPGVPGAPASTLPAARRPQGRQKSSSLPTYRSTFLIPWDAILPPYKRL